MGKKDKIILLKEGKRYRLAYFSIFSMISGVWLDLASQHCFNRLFSTVENSSFVNCLCEASEYAFMYNNVLYPFMSRIFLDLGGISLFLTCLFYMLNW